MDYLEQSQGMEEIWGNREYSNNTSSGQGWEMGLEFDKPTQTIVEK